MPFALPASHTHEKQAIYTRLIPAEWHIWKTHLEKIYISASHHTQK